MRLLIAALLLGGCAARAIEPPPVCSDPGVLRQVDETIRAQGQAVAFDVPPVGEVALDGPAAGPGRAPPLAHCAVRGHIVAYDTNRYGMTPVNEPFIVNYTIEMRHNGLFVSVP